MSIKKIKLPSGKIKWEATFYTRGRSGKKLRRRFDKKSGADAFLLKAKNNAVENIRLKSKHIEEISIDECLNIWLKLKEDEFANSGYLRSIRPAVNRIKEFWGKKKVASLNTLSYADFRNYLKIERRLKPSSVNRYSDILYRVINHCFEKKIISSNPLKEVKRTKDPIKEMKFLSDLDVWNFLQFSELKYRDKKHWIYLSYRMALETAMRARELWGLRCNDLYFDVKQIAVAKQLSYTGKATDSTKGRDIRYVPMSDDLAVIIKKYIRLKNLKDDEYLFKNSWGGTVNHNNFIRRVFKPDLEEAGVKKIRFHDLRHTAITMMVRKGLNPWIVQKIAGHKKIETTLKYVHIVGQDISKVANSLSLGSAETDSNVLSFKKIKS